jgi:hypothetical protein
MSYDFRSEKLRKDYEERRDSRGADEITKTKQ